MRQLIIVGSLNVDYLASVDRLPAPGQTVPADNLVVRFGGKGANQAVAAARQGAPVKLVGCVGADREGRAYVQRLASEGIDVRALRRAEKLPTGRAFISVDRRGENTIVVASGANAALQPRDIKSIDWKGATMVLLQMEVPLETVVAALRAAGRAGVPVMLNAAPLRRSFPWGAIPLDYLVINELEAAELFGEAPGASGVLWDSRHRARLRRWRVRNLIVTRGKKPTCCFLRDEVFTVSTVRMRPVDTVGAGDAFTGTLAAHLASGLPLRPAVELANCAGALATQAVGAQESLPTLQATRRLALRQFSRGRSSSDSCPLTPDPSRFGGTGN